MNLYELTGQYLELLQMAEEGDFDTETIKDTLEGLEGEIEAKADGYGRIIRSLEGDVSTIDDEITRLTARKKMLAGNAATLKKNLEAAMIATGKKKIKTELFSFGIQKNQPSVVIPDEGKVPEVFLVPQPPKVDKKAVLSFLKEAPQAVDWAELKQTESIRMR